jgi:hypothetical protein
VRAKAVTLAQVFGSDDGLHYVRGLYHVGEPLLDAPEVEGGADE